MAWLRNALNRPLPPRVALVRAELARFRRPAYLEIGVNVGVVFLHVRARRKIAVDPVNRIPRWKWLAHANAAARGGFAEMTSDEFFAGLDRGARFDVVFIDGLHTHEQSLRDVESSLAHLSEGGTILVHDCNPTSPEAAAADPRASGGDGWCGEVWKTIVTLRSEREDVRVEVLDTDYGVGVIRRGAGELITPGKPVAELEYADLAAGRQELLGLRPLS